MRRYVTNLETPPLDTIPDFPRKPTASERGSFANIAERGPKSISATAVSATKRAAANANHAMFLADHGPEGRRRNLQAPSRNRPSGRRSGSIEAFKGRVQEGRPLRPVSAAGGRGW